MGEGQAVCHRRMRMSAVPRAAQRVGGGGRAPVWHLADGFFSYFTPVMKTSSELYGQSNSEKTILTIQAQERTEGGWLRARHFAHRLYKPRAFS